MYSTYFQINQHLNYLKTRLKTSEVIKITHRIVRLVRVFQALDVVQELLQVGRQVFQQQPVVVLLLHEPNLLLVFHFPPGKLPVHELHQHVEQAPQVVVAAHF